MKTIIYKLEQLTCPSCVTKIDKALGKKKGVIEANTSFNSSKVKVIYDDSIVTIDDITFTIEKLGFEIMEVISKQ